MYIPFFTILSGLNGYNSLSNKVYYPLATVSGLIVYLRASSKYDELPLDRKLNYGYPGRFAITALATGMGMGLSGVVGHYMGRAIREVVDSRRHPPASISCPENPSSLHNGA